MLPCMADLSFDAVTVECVIDDDEGLTALFFAGPPRSDRRLSLSRTTDDADVEIVLGAQEHRVCTIPRRLALDGDRVVLELAEAAARQLGGIATIEVRLPTDVDRDAVERTLALLGDAGARLRT